jgi:hypothetical protein
VLFISPILSSSTSTLNYKTGLFIFTHVYGSSLEHKPLKIFSSVEETDSGADKTLAGSPVTEMIRLQWVRVANTVNFCQDYVVILLHCY